MLGSWQFIYISFLVVFLEKLPDVQINYLCTYDLYSPVRNVFDAGRYITWGRGGTRGECHLGKAVNREDKLSRRYRDRDLAKFESSRRYRER